MKCDDNNLANLLATAIFKLLNHWSAIDSIIEFHSTETNVSNFKLNATSYTLSIDMLQVRPDRDTGLRKVPGPRQIDFFGVNGNVSLQQPLIHI